MPITREEQVASAAETENRFVSIRPPARPAKPKAASRNFYEHMRSRRSIRTFTSEAVEQEVILNAIRAAGTAPSGANCQPWFFGLIESQEKKERLRQAAEEVEDKFYSYKAPANWLKDLSPLGTNAQKPYLSIAPAVIAVFTRQNESSEIGPRVYYPMESTGIAVGILITALHRSGLATLTHTPRPMQFLNELLGLDHTYRPFMIVVAGYPETPIKVPDISKKPLEEICKIY